MRITVQMQDGRQHAFTIADEKAGAAFIAQIRFWEIFDRPVLRINNGKDAWAFSPASIEKIDFDTDAEPPWRPPENILATKCITPETWRRKIERLDQAAKPPADMFEPGKCIETTLAVTLASGAVEYFECTLMLRERRAQMLNLYRLFDKVGHPVPREGGGFVLLNPRRIHCIRMHPAPAEDAESAWLVDGPAEPALQ
ncbi:hypothetical protein LLG95_12505 [bacterium]|nr:hypothetical protein [bacterium]